MPAPSFVCELPNPGPWKLAAWAGGVLAVSPHHAPRFVAADGTVTVLEALPPAFATQQERSST